MSIAQGNINEDFFEQNSELTILPEVKKLISSEKKAIASKIMWAIYLLEDPNSLYYRMPREERILEIKKEYYDLDLVKYKLLINEYTKLILTKEESMLKYFLDTMEKLVTRLSELNLNTSTGLNDTIKILDKIPKIWDGLEKIKAKMKEEGSKTQIKGNAREGAREQKRRKK